jgi:hypothetical protein
MGLLPVLLTFTFSVLLPAFAITGLSEMKYSPGINMITLWGCAP